MENDYYWELTGNGSIYVEIGIPLESMYTVWCYIGSYVRCDSEPLSFI